MQKKLIALAVAALASSAAFAQSNVTIYGLIDYGYTYRFDAQSATGLGDTPGSQSQINGGQSMGNRLGFKGSEDLGNGLKAVFLLEQGFQSDTGDEYTSGKAFSRQAYVGLNGNFGTVIGGRLYTPHYTFVQSLDPFAAGTVGRYQNAFSTVGAVAGSTLTDVTRVDNALAYVSPSFGGFSLTGAFSNNAFGQEATASNAANNSVYALFGKYENGPLMVGLNYHYIAAGTTVGLDNVQNVDFGGSYDFGVAKVSALYSWNQIDYGSAVNGNAELNNWMLGVSAPFAGKFVGKASYMYSDGNKEALGNAQQFAVGLDYNLSKRTALYSAYSWVDNQDGRLSGVGDASNSATYSGNGYGAGVFTQGVQAGLRHSF